MGKLTDEELTEAYDEICKDCDLFTQNSNDGGKIPCNGHLMLYMQRTYPVLKMDGMMDGEWTHSLVDTRSMNTWLEEILQEWSDSSLTMQEFLRNLNLQVVQMTKEDYEGIPEL